MKKFIYYSSLLSLFVCLIFCVLIQATYYHFDSSSVKNNIKTISSNEYEGRLTGSYGNEKASYFIENFFKENNLSSINDNYRENFEVITPIKNDKVPEFKITQNDNLIHEYKYGVDFKEDLLNFNESSITFTKKDKIDIYPSSLIITHNGKLYSFYVSFDKTFSFRSSFNATSPYEFSIAITTEVYNGILDSLRANNNISITLPYSKKQTITSNVFGVIKGSNSSLPPLVLTAHFDHVGVDYLNNYYNGALDNASGTAFLLELSKSFSSFIKPERDIIFVALTGEEFGLLGSSQFAKEYNDLIKYSKVINFDMIGAAHTPISIVSGSACKNKEDADNELLDSIKNICSNKNIDYTVSFQDSSDHASFTNNGIDCVTLCHSDVSKIHTPNDKINFIDESAINDVYSVVQEEIYNHAYSNFKLFLYNPNLILFLFISFLVILIFPSANRKFKSHINNN